MNSITPKHGEWTTQLTNGKNGFVLTVSGQTPAGPERINYSLSLADSTSLNERILLLQVSPEPTEGDQMASVVPYVAEYEREDKYLQVQIIERDTTTTVDIDIPKK
ncbi:hypothetical protein [Pedobacter gandavensis]|uniref:hypothetical protein n=1 Tax=Pedobacter gandavensis TaxID=2679963 RepID=UPI0029300BCA|nr:hypothetical protein [Pedobacter gandavensis]